MFLNIVRGLLFIYFVCLHLHCCFTWTERIVNTPFSATIVSFASHRTFQWPAVFVPHCHVCCMRNNECQIAYLSLLKCRFFYIISGKRKMILWPLVSWIFLSLQKETRYALRNQVTLLKEARLAPNSSLNYLMGKIETNVET